MVKRNSRSICTHFSGVFVRDLFPSLIVDCMSSYSSFLSPYSSPLCFLSLPTQQPNLLFLSFPTPMMNTTSSKCPLARWNSPNFTNEKTPKGKEIICVVMYIHSINIFLYSNFPLLILFNLPGGVESFSQHFLFFFKL